jgi:hypothetical protein
MLNAARSSPSGAMAAIYSSSIIRSAVSPCEKKAVEPDGVLRFAVLGPGSGCPTRPPMKDRYQGRQDRPR